MSPKSRYLTVFLPFLKAFLFRIFTINALFADKSVILFVFTYFMPMKYMQAIFELAVEFQSFCCYPSADIATL